MLKVPLYWEAVLVDVGGTGEGGRPSKLRLPKDGGGGLPRDVTERRPDVGEGEGRMRRGRESQLDRWLLLMKEEERQMMAPPRGRLGVQLPAVCVGPLQLHRDGGGASQVLVARMLESL